MPNLYATEFTVRGKGHFPIDMLRYDACHPATQEDVAWMASEHEERELMLRRIGTNKQWKPTAERWSSFGWVVTEVYSVRKL